MASLIPVIANDARNTAFQHLGGDKQAVNRTVNKWGNYAKSPGRSMWGSVRNFFGFGIIPITYRRTRKPAPKKGGRSVRLKPGPKPRKRK